MIEITPSQAKRKLIYGGKNVRLHSNPIFAAEKFSATFIDRFWQKVNKTENCWLWTGSKANGYGEIGRGKDCDGTIRAHVASWIIHNSPIPKGLWVLHNCPGGDNPACVNPAHLWLGTVLDNNRDLTAKGHSVFGERNGRSKLTWKQVMEIRAIRASTGISHKALADKYSISRSQIGNILAKTEWKHHNYSRSIDSYPSSPSPAAVTEESSSSGTSFLSGLST